MNHDNGEPIKSWTQIFFVVSVIFMLVFLTGNIFYLSHRVSKLSETIDRAEKNHALIKARFGIMSDEDFE